MRVLDTQSADSLLDLVNDRSQTGTKSPSKLFVVVKGLSPEIGNFVSRLREVAESVDWREVIWVQDSKKLTRTAKGWFQRSNNACAVILRPGLEPVSLLDCRCSRYDISVALLEAMRPKSAVGAESGGPPRIEVV